MKIVFLIPKQTISVTGSPGMILNLLSGLTADSAGQQDFFIWWPSQSSSEEKKIEALLGKDPFLFHFFVPHLRNDPSIDQLINE